jgi:hypothetical protein
MEQGYHLGGHTVGNMATDEWSNRVSPGNGKITQTFKLKFIILSKR